ncbi:hypothetical protein PLESTB_001124700 [Pleodorina starrii]|uniref:Uncharacterized protein n=1 Tax=Pleodorina starrii TaxID=330485 RepID=A0A9W6F5L4_9CHLO|nr:hypothetical protein PLESTM_001362100 [Pleodorina starrii]GLC56595.1 hypothetical protein PLESTB_001124700 [Pleodorina starrii]
MPALQPPPQQQPPVLQPAPQVGCGVGGWRLLGGSSAGAEPDLRGGGTAPALGSPSLALPPPWHAQPQQPQRQSRHTAPQLDLRWQGMPESQSLDHWGLPALAPPVYSSRRSSIGHPAMGAAAVGSGAVGLRGGGAAPPLPGNRGAYRSQPYFQPWAWLGSSRSSGGGAAAAAGTSAVLDGRDIGVVLAPGAARLHGTRLAAPPRLSEHGIAAPAGASRGGGGGGGGGPDGGGGGEARPRREIMMLCDVGRAEGVENGAEWL